MLEYRLLRGHAGILLIGDYTTLRCFHEAVHEVGSASPLVRSDDGPLMDLAYEIRRAFEQQREIISAPQGYEEIGIRFGAKILWPAIIVQQRILRTSMAYFNSQPLHQAMTYALEHVLEHGLRDDFGDRADGIIEKWRRIDPGDPRVFEKLRSRIAICASWKRSERKRLLAQLLASLDHTYESAYRFHVERGVRNLVDPTEVDRWDQYECPDPRW
ncbi:hypothetical protein [Thalassobaculum sp.]|uniref:DUF6904 family protein n=1 Tax=Thalassobaculum sp. TaxID=2022740 RepID=UPI0032EB1D56